MHTMSKSSTTTTDPDWLDNHHAGEMLALEFMEPLGLTAATLAEALAIAPARLEGVIAGHIRMDADLDLRLARYFRRVLPRAPGRLRTAGSQACSEWRSGTDRAACRIDAPMETRPFDPANYLETEEDILYYLEAAMEGNDAGHIASALGDVARSKGMSEIARKSGLGRQALYNALSENGNPTLETLTAVLGALGLRLTVQKTVA